MGNRKKSRLTFVVISDVDRPVRSLRIPKPLLYWIPGSCAAALAATLLWLGSVQRGYEEEIVALKQTIEHNTAAYRYQLSGKDSTIQQLQDDLLVLAEQADAVQARLDELQALERELRDITGLPQEDSEAPQEAGTSYNLTTLSQPLAAGGEHRLGSNDQLARLAERIRGSFLLADGQMTDLTPHLEAAREALLEEIEIRKRTPSIWPTASREVTSGFGFRRDPFTGRSAHHSGIDIADDKGSTVYATAKGKVEEEGWDSQKGNYIILSHGYDLHTIYMHLSKIDVSEGQQIEKGEAIGQMGSTGRSTGPHLHYEVHKSRKPVNPAPFLK